jgi:hypothetical protein
VEALRCHLPRPLPHHPPSLRPLHLVVSSHSRTLVALNTLDYTETRFLQPPPPRFGTLAFTGLSILKIGLLLLTEAPP